LCPDLTGGSVTQCPIESTVCPEQRTECPKLPDICSGPIEVDRFPDSLIELDLCTPQGTVPVRLTGPHTVEVRIGLKGEARDDNSDGLDEVPTEIVAMDLKGDVSPLGVINLRLRDPAKPPFLRSIGGIQERENLVKGILDVAPFGDGFAVDSFFDIWTEITVETPDGTRVIGHNEAPVRVQGLIHRKPPAPGDVLKGSGSVALVDENGKPTGYSICGTLLTPNPVLPSAR